MLVAFAIIISPLSLYFSFPFRAGQYFFCTVQFGAASMMFVVGLLGVAPIQYARSMLLLLLLARAKGSFPPPSSWQKKSSFNWQLAGRSSVCKFAFPANFGTTHLLACRQMSFLFQQLHQKQKKPSTGRERRLQSRNTQIHTHCRHTTFLNKYLSGKAKEMERGKGKVENRIERCKKSMMLSREYYENRWQSSLTVCLLQCSATSRSISTDSEYISQSKKGKKVKQKHIVWSLVALNTKY